MHEEIYIYWNDLTFEVWVKINLIKNYENINKAKLANKQNLKKVTLINVFYT